MEIKLRATIIIIISILLVASGLFYFNTTKTYYGEDCRDYNWYLEDKIILECVECDFKFNSELITEGFDVKQRYLDGCKEMEDKTAQ